MPAARPSDANLRRAVALAKAEGVTVEVESKGTVFRIIPAPPTPTPAESLDATPAPVQPRKPKQWARG